MNQRNKAIRHKLSSLLNEVKSIKSDLKHLQQLQKQFSFESLLPSKYSKISKMQSLCQKQNDENKQNMPINTTKAQKRTQIKQSKQLFMSEPKYKQQKDSTAKLDHNNNNNDQISLLANQQLKDLKAGLIMQLNQIKSMEKKSESMRRANERIKEYNSHQKKSYRQSLSREKYNSLNTSLHDISQISQSSTPLVHLKQVDSLIIQSKVSLNPMLNPSVQIVAGPSIASSSECCESSKILHCPKHHQYYEGSVNSNNKPHGNGRLDICCTLICNGDVGGHGLKDCVFYQGMFYNGLFHGFGTLSYKGGIKYVGEFKFGKRHGKGSIYCNGRAQVANWNNDVFVSII